MRPPKAGRSSAAAGPEREAAESDIRAAASAIREVVTRAAIRPAEVIQEEVIQAVADIRVAVIRAAVTPAVLRGVAADIPAVIRMTIPAVGNQVP